MNFRRKIVIVGSALVVGVAIYFALPYAFLGFAVGRSLHDQELQNAAAKPLFDSAVTKKLKIGDSVVSVEKVLSDAGLSYSVDKTLSSHGYLHSIYRAGRLSGFGIDLEFDGEDRLSKIDIREFFTGP